MADPAGSPAGCVTDRPVTTMEHVENAADGAGFESFVDTAVGGNREALSLLLARIHPLVVRCARSRLSSGHRSLSTADDVAQEVCMAVMTALPSYRRDGRPFLAFVYGIASHKVVDAHRAAGRSRSTPVDSVPETPVVDGGPEALVLAQSSAHSMAGLLKSLTPVHREILRLRIGVGLSAEDTA